MQLIKTDIAIAPRPAQTAEHGSIVPLATSAVAVAIDLRTIGFQGAPTLASGITQAKGAVSPFQGDRIGIRAITSDVGVIFGTALADVTGGFAPALATVSTVAANAVTAVAGGCHRIPAGQYQEFRLRPGVDYFLGFVAAAAGQLDIYQVNMPNE